MILFMLQRNTKAYSINIAGLIVGSLEGAATVRDRKREEKRKRERGVYIKGYSMFGLNVYIQIFFN